MNWKFTKLKLIVSIGLPILFMLNVLYHNAKNWYVSSGFLGLLLIILIYLVPMILVIYSIWSLIQKKGNQTEQISEEVKQNN